MEVKVRMYRQGLGDCFLLSFKGKKSSFHMLIDCGVLPGTDNAKDKMEEVVASIVEATDGKLDLLVATHQHWDHLSGFLQAQEKFKKDLKVAQVWLAWTEDPSNKLAQELRRGREEKLSALYSALQRMEGIASNLQQLKELTPDDRRVQLRMNQRVTAIKSVLSFFGDPPGPDKDKGNALNEDKSMPPARSSNTTKAALEFLCKLPGAKIKYCTPGGDPLPLEGIEGVRIYVLGPPEDSTLIKKSDPTKKGKEVYEEFSSLTLEDAFRAAVDDNQTSVRSRELCFPFDEDYKISRATAENDLFFKQYYGFDGDDEENKDGWRRIDNDWLGVTGQLALSLDSDTNNTSLALAIEFVESGDVFLFPADAQVGNWLSWENLSWQVASKEGKETRRVTTKELLERTILYKVGHHGSHNATLREKGLEMMTSQKLIALIPVSREMAKEKEWNMPFPPLLKRLREKTRGRVILADEDKLPDRKKEENLVTLSDAEWKEFRDPKRTKILPLYVELTFNQ
jgi:hypothetical protein